MKGFPDFTLKTEDFTSVKHFIAPLRIRPFNDKIGFKIYKRVTVQVSKQESLVFKLVNLVIHTIM